MARRNALWPVLREYDQEHLHRIALPLGGIGTGTVGLSGRGGLVDWEIMNRPAKGYIPDSAATGRGLHPFFACWAKAPGREPQARLLQGPLEYSEYEGAMGSQAPHHGLPRFRSCSFAAAYPLGQVHLADPDLPIRVRLEAFNPLIPGDADRSGMPVAILRYVLENRTDRPVQASVCGTLPNFIGADGSTTQKDWMLRDKVVGSRENRNRRRTSKGLQGLFMESKGVHPQAEAWGTLALATDAKRGVSRRTAWAELSWGDSLLDFWDEFSASGTVRERQRRNADAPVGSVAVKTSIPTRGEKCITFYLAWHFPNRRTWTPQKEAGAGTCSCKGDPDIIGNYYCTQYRDAWAAATAAAANRKRLEADTVEFVSSFLATDLPDTVQEAALFNLSTLRSQTVFRTPDGLLFGWEGCCDGAGCCLGSCTHVWNYEQATAFLFGDLARTMREVEFVHATRPDGMMPFRVHLPIERAREMGAAAADGQMGCIMKMYRDWQLCGDDDWLQRLWPQVRRALEFAWIPGGWDGDRDGVMEGCQHNTMDVEYYGPNPQMQIWYLGALRAAEEMARYLGEADFAARCRSLFDQGRTWFDSHLFNGEYYEHEIRPPRSAKAIASSLRYNMGARDLKNPELQLGAGCLVDQLVGQFMAEVCGLGPLTRRDHVRKTLRAIMKHNFKEGFHDHFNHMRSYVLGDEAALLMATYPRGRRPQRPFPYYNEVMTGFEYTAAVHMLYEGQHRNGLKVIAAIRDRYDGRRRNPFDEAECGHHYARAMASWAAVLALTGFHYSAVTGTVSFAPRPGRHFWSTGHAWGTCTLQQGKRGWTAELAVQGGVLPLKRLDLAPAGMVELPRQRRLGAGTRLRLSIRVDR